ncbi:pyridoxal phosphate-dependent aminotransferase [Antarcticirhabdus aurantiaca]|uniref:Pyridoxal phosphate-dependent aminotransferase n=1 Tax=Antarcticirhabdus aurantiaca TaxID=2606717 RepID=A0ACD4NU42_9HYPH|nr:pyridoxal phosphate-dependent aminotransferase [Antarcticirhabdus aurantiaca]WAJ30382.1 pyridoxal phosphate-dependent aminotransferase [Jeongeuplla avenae]
MSDLQRLRREALDAPESGIVAVINYARGREGLIPLWAGEGDLATPDFISGAAAESLKAGETFYTWQRGLPELRQAIADYATRLYGTSLGPDRFFVTSSGMHAIQIVCAMLAGAGDELVFVGPAWPNFAAAAEVNGAKAREVSLDWSTAQGWSLDMAKLRAAVGPATKAIFLNTPSNPTGWTATREDLAAVLDLARSAGIFVIADEIYSRFFYAGARAPSFHDVATPDDPVIYVNSFSKNWAMTGWRVGWIEAPAAFGDVIENLVQYSTSGVPAFVQRGALAAIRHGEDFVEEQVQRAHRARDIFTDALLSTNRVEIVPPAGAFYAFFAVDGLEDTRAAAFRICDEAGVGLAPGTAFGPAGRRFLRACFHRRLDEVEASAERLARWIGRAA